MGLFVKKFEFGKDEGSWNRFIQNAKNATFLFNRDFMNYHSDRFMDHSALVFDKKNMLLACFPANEVNKEEVASHEGLTYGGLIIDASAKLPVQLEVFKAILKYYAKMGFSKISYKAFPRFYNHLQTDEIEYCLFLAEAKLFRKDTTLVVDYGHRIPYSGNIRREAKKAKMKGVSIRVEEDFGPFWRSVLEPNLQNRFGVAPVHSVKEISFLKNSFPNEIQLFTARSEAGKMLAGTVIFVTEMTAHCQYISATEEGRRLGALSILFITILDEYFQDHRYFDFGTANENEGMAINQGLLAWKERMGGRAYAHDFYRINTEAYKRF